jgi:hypothetical protein
VKSHLRAFGRADLLFCLFALSLVFALVLPILGSNKSESQRVICFNNLRQIGRAFHVWGNDFGDALPWHFLTRPEGGTGPPPQFGSLAWFQYVAISNQLGSPKILVCPADLGTTKVASEWSTSPNGGFLNINYRANATSYPLFLHALPNAPASLLSGDRNFRVDGFGLCSLSPPKVFICFRLDQGGLGKWTNAVHGVVGHLLFMDGSVPFTTSNEFQQAISTPLQDDGGSLHGPASALIYESQPLDACCHYADCAV